MAGLRGQTGSSTNIMKPLTKKQKKDAKLRKEDINREFGKRKKVKAYYCPNCNNRSESANEKHDGTKFCTSCFVNYSKIIDVTETTITVRRK